MSYDRIYNFFKDKKGFVLENIKNSWQKNLPHKICHLYIYIHTYIHTFIYLNTYLWLLRGDS